MSHYTILLVDYEPRSVEQLRGPLVQAGYRVEVAKDGIAGGRRFVETKPDLALVEAMIPKKNGFELCLELKRTPHGQTTPVLIITGVYKGRKYRSQAMHEYRCDAYLEKPITAEQLVEIVRQHLERFRPDGPVGQPRPTEVRPATQTVEKAPSPSEDSAEEAEIEILDRLDEILPDEPGKIRSRPPRAAVLDFEAPDPATRRTRHARGGALPAMAQLPDVERRFQVAAERGRAELRPGPPAPRPILPGRLWLWLALAVIAAFGAAMILVLL